jgi:molybdenum cofactor biosynthesis enzyme MoaA
VADNFAKSWDMLRLLRHGGPALCNIAVTNSCNAKCGFCNFATGKVHKRDLRWIDPERFADALEILHRRKVRYVSFFGGEPLVHPHLADLIQMAPRAWDPPSSPTVGCCRQNWMNSPQRV